MYIKCSFKIPVSIRILIWEKSRLLIQVGTLKL